MRAGWSVVFLSHDALRLPYPSHSSSHLPCALRDWSLPGSTDSHADLLSSARDRQCSPADHMTYTRCSERKKQQQIINYLLYVEPRMYVNRRHQCVYLVNDCLKFSLLWPWPWPRPDDLDIRIVLKTYLRARNAVPNPRLSKLTAWTTQTDRQMRPNVLPHMCNKMCSGLSDFYRVTLRRARRYVLWVNSVCLSVLLDVCGVSKWLNVTCR